VTDVDTDDEFGPNAPTPRDGSFNVFFSEQVNVTGAWYDITCTATLTHTATVYPGITRWIVTPDVNFQPGEQCAFRVFASQVKDADANDDLPNTDQMQADYTETFTVATGTAPPETPDVHLVMGNPTDAVADLGTPNNYLMEKPEFALSFNRNLGTPNWVSWHLSDDTDLDGIADCVDPDDDNDGQSDAGELECGSDPLDRLSKSPDIDNDNIPDCVDPVRTPGTIDDCQNGGWMLRTRLDGSGFRNQGDCIQYVITGG
jgi:hypothetical protein